MAKTCEVSSSSAAAADIVGYVRSLYIAERRVLEERITGRQSAYLPGRWWDGGITRSGERPSVWPKIAKYMLDNNLDPASYIHSIFSIKKLSRTPEPPELYNKNYLAVYKTNLASEDDTIRNSITVQAQIANERAGILKSGTNLTADQILLNVLFDEMLPLSALFRYCAARRVRLKQVCEEYETAAVLQYLRNKTSYDNHWGDVIGDGFKELSERTKRKLMGSI